MTSLARRWTRVGLLVGAAHHPLCTRFRHDVVRVAGLHVCGGCLATWPTCLLALPLALQARLDGAPALALLAVGFTLGLPQMTAYWGRRSRGQRAAAKVLGGAGLASAFIGAVTSGWPLPVVVAAVGAGVAAIFGLQVLRLRSILATCDACPFKRDWETCPGFAGQPAPGNGPAPLPGAPTSLVGP